jgi:diaminopimelate epimerase
MCLHQFQHASTTRDGLFMGLAPALDNQTIPVKLRVPFRNIYDEHGVGSVVACGSGVAFAVVACEYVDVREK